ncbi:MAG: hypothetical protein AAGG48_20255 [Planctomycetota bacterium]
MSDAADLCYPPKADANGTAKKYYRRRAYYFGRHNTPESLILFGEWKRRLIETGEPPEVKTVRVDLEHSLEAREKGRKYRAFIWPAVTALSSCLLATTITASVMIFSTNNVAKVDGKVLTGEEVLYLRGYRNYNGLVQAVTRGSHDEERIAEIYKGLLESGPGNEPLHNKEMD